MVTVGILRTAATACRVDGCARLPVARGWCLMHYKRWWKHGDPSVVRWERRADICIIEDCGRPHEARGWCNKHYLRWWHSGDPLRAMTGKLEGHPAWTGDDASYNATHIRLRASRGPARHHLCVDCGHRAGDWSYAGGAPDERSDTTGANAGHPFSLNMAFYVPRCRPCHLRFDRRREARAA